MTLPHTPSADAVPSDAAVREGIDRLQAILVQVDVFLAAWMDRYETSTTTVAPLPLAPPSPASAPTPNVEANVASGNLAADKVTDASLAKRIAEFETEKQRWQAHRDSESKRLAEKFEQLAAGWLHLEAERRALLQNKQAQRSRRPPATVDTGAGDVSAETPPMPAPPCAKPTPIASGPNNRGPVSEVSGGRSDQAVQQFQQLRRQIDSRRDPREPS